MGHSAVRRRRQIQQQPKRREAREKLYAIERAESARARGLAIAFDAKAEQAQVDLLTAIMSDKRQTDRTRLRAQRQLERVLARRGDQAVKLLTDETERQRIAATNALPPTGPTLNQQINLMSPDGSSLVQSLRE